MATYSDVQNEVLLHLEGFANDQAVMAAVGVGGVSDSATSIPTTGGAFADGSGMSTGMWEVGEELVFVLDFNRSTGTATNVIRGWRGTAAAAHAEGAVIRNNPRFPLTQVKRAINDTIRNLHPRVPAVRTADITTLPAKMRYALPADCKGVLSLSVQSMHDHDAWTVPSVWRFDPRPGGSYSGGTAIDLPFETHGATVRVIYVAEPAPLSSGTDDFEATTGLPSFAREAVVWGAVWRLYSMTELGRGGFSSADQAMLNTGDRFGKPTALARYLRDMFSQAVADAEARILDLYPVRKHYIW